MKRPLFSIPIVAIIPFGLAAASLAAPPRPGDSVKAAAPDAAAKTCAQNPCPPGGGESGRQPVDVDVQTLQPYNLPPASREKMRACGEEWRTLKLAGQATGLTWRSFAEKCLVK
ncbi:hypothetical protein M2322_000903 [Rhodoblastus acidophilus]|uniref:hypothetical protein n=1 Tax=Rhodoblastus acidophilus TaxID=1074 RepID=UPI0022246FB9|nr:hypothetical protein [Rhodoblastus acidophilus]MCW2315369.1 hypothetical protein [Rhodoblastus acidophilus]